METANALITAVGDWFTAAIGWTGTVGTTILGNPLLLGFAALPVVGLGVGLFKRLLRIN